MVEKPVDRSRRMRAVASGVTAALLLRISQTDASEKMTRQQDVAEFMIGRVFARPLAHPGCACFNSSFRGARSASPESITTTGSMDSGPAPRGASRNDASVQESRC